MRISLRWLGRCNPTGMRNDIQDVIRQLMSPDDMLETFSQIGVEDPDLARVTLGAAVSALVKSQAVLAIDDRPENLNRSELKLFVER